MMFSRCVPSAIVASEEITQFLITQSFDYILPNEKHNADLIITCAYGQIIPEEILNQNKETIK